jgi:hypothetical protein
MDRMVLVTDHFTEDRSMMETVRRSRGTEVKAYGHPVRTKAEFPEPFSTGESVRAAGFRAAHELFSAQKETLGQ